VLRGVAGLTVGTTITRGIAAGSQILLAFWLSPAEFGYWAAATSAIALLSGLANFGEVNAYLSGHGSNFRGVRRSTRLLNLGLTAAAAAVAAGYLFGDKPEVATLAFIAAFSIPFGGDAELMYSTGVKVKKYRAVVLAQVAGAISKLVVGVALAAATGSAIAIAVSTLVFFLVMDIGLLRVVKRETSHEVDEQKAAPLRSRITWAANSLSMTLPLQVGFLVAQFIASPALLGLYFFSFQVTLGISGLVAAPLARVSLSTLGAMAGEARQRMALRLSHYFGLGMLAVVALVSLLLPAFLPVVPADWAAAVPAVAILLASLPIRMIGPVVDAYQQATNKWWQGTAFNILDTLGTAAAALFALTGDILILVLAATVWKILLGVIRCAYVFRDSGSSTLIRLLGPALLGSILVVLIPFNAELGIWLACAAVLVALAWAALLKASNIGDMR
jgi:O-antigen/teichoic acid export membrane protein